MDLHHAGWLHARHLVIDLKIQMESIEWLDDKTMRADFTYYSNDNYENLQEELLRIIIYFKS